MSDERDDRLFQLLVELGTRLDRFDRHEKKLEQAQYQMMAALEIASIARLQGQSGRERI